MIGFPSTYTIGITSLGYQVIWSILAKRSDVDVKRIFTDVGDKFHKTCDLFGLSLSWELDGPVLLDLLEKQHINLWSKHRKENDPLVFGGGPVLTANPEPFAPFFDIILLGEGEDLVPKFIDNLQQVRNQSRIDKLKFLSNIPGIYIPSLYVPTYTSDGILTGLNPIDTNIPATIKKQTSQGNSLSHSQVVTPDAAWPNIHMVEVVRSCPELCRFCLASYLTLPFRSPSLEAELIPAIQKGLTVTNRLGLLGASVTQHPEFMELMHWLNKPEFDNIRLSISSVRATTVGSQLTKLLAKHGSKSITIAIESGSERLRNIINKKLTQEEIFSAAKYTEEGGLKSLKLYGMVGLPYEEDIDIDATIDLILKIKEKISKLRIVLSLSTFVPKAHTPFQWYGVKSESKKRIKQIVKKLQSKGIEVRPESYRLSLIQALFARSDRRLAPVILAVRGSENSISAWKKAYKEAREKNFNLNYENQNICFPKPPPWEEIIHEQWTESKILPWEHIEGPLKSELLIKHLEDAMSYS